MLKALSGGKTRGSKIHTTSMPAPIGGWNARAPLAEMPSTNAVVLDNFFPLTTQLALRDGYTDHVTGITGTVNTLMGYNSPTTRKMFAAAGSAIYDVTNPGTVGGAVVTGMTSDKWQHVNVTTPGGSFMLLANGSDSMQLYDGTNWSASTITGVTTASIIHLNVFKTRVWMVERNSLKAWYLPSQAITGAAAQWDLSSIFKRGGFLMAMGNWSLDAGQGLDDYAAFVTSQGEVAIYKGTDPASASTFSLVGLFDVGTPIGRRCLVKYAGDVLLISNDGLLPLSKALMSSRVSTNIAITDNITQAVSEKTLTYGSTFGWQVILYPAENMLLLNIPVTDAAEQYVMNAITGAWCRFTGWNATCWERFNDLIYFGTAGGVCLAWSGQSDNGLPINGEALQAFSYFGSDGQLKKWSLVRPIFSTNGNPGVSVGINVDFDLSAPASIPSFTPISTAIWDTAVWDTDAWAGDLSIKKDWLSVNGYGKCAAIHMRISTSTVQLKWAATDYNYEFGGYL